MWPSATVDSVMKQQEINLDFSRRQVMTIVNVTPDSFFAGSRTPDWLDVERRVREAVEAGLAPDGGLFVPERIPQADMAVAERLAGESYAALAG